MAQWESRESSQKEKERNKEVKKKKQKTGKQRDDGGECILYTTQSVPFYMCLVNENIKYSINI